jgi:hypothetical protein
MKILHCLLIITFLVVFIQHAYSFETNREESLVREIEALKKHKDDSYQAYLRAWRQVEDAKNDVKDDVRQSYQNTHSEYQKSRDKFVSEIKQALETAKTKYQEERENVRKSLEELKAYKNDKKGEAKDAYENTKQLGQQKYRSAKNTLSKYYNQVYNELYTDYEKAKELVSSAKTQYARDEAQKLYTSAKANLREAYDRVVEFGESSLETGRDLIDTLKEYSQYYSQQVADKTKGGLEAAKQTVSEGIEAAKQAAGNVKQNTAETVDSAKQSASENLQSAQQTVSQKVDSAKNSAANGVETAQQTAADGLETVKEAASNVYDTLEAEYEAAKTQAADFLERAKIWMTEDDNVHRAKIDATHDTANPHINHLHQDL